MEEEIVMIRKSNLKEQKENSGLIRTGKFTDLKETWIPNMYPFITRQQKRYFQKNQTQKNMQRIQGGLRQVAGSMGSSQQHKLLEKILLIKNLKDLADEQGMNDIGFREQVIGWILITYTR